MYYEIIDRSELAAMYQGPIKHLRPSFGRDLQSGTVVG